METSSQLKCDLIKTKNFFNKRTFTLKSFIYDIRRILLRRNLLIDTFRSQRLSKKFIEHIMLVSTAVTECIYCEWAHTSFALQAGCTDEEILSILGLDFDTLPENEFSALAFAQHFAESNASPEASSLKTLKQNYGSFISNDIINYLLIIRIGNLLGNTVSAFISRLKGIPPEEGSIAFELIVFIFGGLIIDQKLKK